MPKLPKHCFENDLSLVSAPVLESLRSDIAVGEKLCTASEGYFLSRLCKEAFAEHAFSHIEFSADCNIAKSSKSMIGCLKENESTTGTYVECRCKAMVFTHFGNKTGFSANKLRSILFSAIGIRIHFCLSTKRREHGNREVQQLQSTETCRFGFVRSGTGGQDIPSREGIETLTRYAQAA